MSDYSSIDLYKIFVRACNDNPTQRSCFVITENVTDNRSRDA